ncbi:DUF2841 domain-containing protein [Aspergillus candidus]|uniref:Subtelomeric hrmA-associated cluster protein AFUB-079030/YDR124W-like helical bundle domain-containing protein n=1 Tax=Aspergillus candidus TaxID=41067 RepID=A0A2I2FCK8_ASPCN|nr:hypothetical protein BDW47DRAFT_28315 [Aspergillus candidus]PLB38358.1 hypothetical protein BDW47DRAFT_28315 [Aspergillus candidus]
MASPGYSMDAIGHPVPAKGDEHPHMLPYHDMTAQPRPANMQCPPSAAFNPPFTHFALMYVDRNGELQVDVSPSLMGYERSIFTQEVRDRFLKSTSFGWQANLPSFHSNSVSHMDGDATGKQPYVFGLQQNASGWYGAPGPARPAPTGLIPCEWQSLQNNKRHRRNMRRMDSGIDRDSSSSSPSSSIRWTALRVGDKETLRSYYDKAFENFQQLNCRAIAKAFVKLVEPRKQVNHPYNGRKTAAGLSQRVDPELTKPQWWPAGVTHKEPDHLLKSDRIRLLVHILCELRESHGITADKLKDAGQDVRRQIMPAERIQVLDEIYYVRDMEEMYLDGKISADTVVHVSHVHMGEAGASELEDGATTNLQSLPVPIITVKSDAYNRPESHQQNIDPSLDPHSTRKGGFLPPSPVSVPSVSRKNSLDSSVSTSSSDLVSSMMTSAEPGRTLYAPKDVHTTGATCLPEYFAQHQSTAHNTQSGFWDPLHPSQPSISFHGY